MDDLAHRVAHRFVEAQRTAAEAHVEKATSSLMTAFTNYEKEHGVPPPFPYSRSSNDPRMSHIIDALDELASARNELVISRVGAK
jgi:hypothetical protein